MGLDRPLPSGEFFDRQRVGAASVLDLDGAAAHGGDNYGLAPRDPAFCVRGRQLHGIGAIVWQKTTSGTYVPTVHGSIDGDGNGFKKITTTQRL
jgi:hypothetical protein